MLLSLGRQIELPTKEGADREQQPLEKWEVADSNSSAPAGHLRELREREDLSFRSFSSHDLAQTKAALPSSPTVHVCGSNLRNCFAKILEDDL